MQASENVALRSAIANYRRSSVRRSLGQFGLTLAAYLTMNALMYMALDVSVWLTLALALPTAGLVVRLFIIQHDCGHGAYLSTRRSNETLGRFCSVLTLTPYSFWLRQHNEHHGAFNNLDRRGSGLDLYSTCLTVEEYRDLPRLGPSVYRISRHPAVSQLLLPPLIFLLLYRVPFGPKEAWSRDGVEVLGTNLSIAASLIPLIATFGIGAVAVVQIPIIALASIVGAWLFCVQHRFESTLWSREADWSWR